MCFSPQTSHVQPASPLQLSTSIKAKEVHFIAHLALRNQKGSKCIWKDSACLSRSYRDEKLILDPSRESCRFRTMPGGMAVTKGTAAEGQLHSKLESSVPGTWVDQAAIVGRAIGNRTLCDGAAANGPHSRSATGTSPQLEKVSSECDVSRWCWGKGREGSPGDYDSRFS